MIAKASPFMYIREQGPLPFIIVAPLLSAYGGYSSFPRVYEGLKPNGVLILNSPKELLARPHENLTVAGVTDANRIAMEEIGMAAPNICMLGTFAAATNWNELPRSKLRGINNEYPYS